MEMRTIESDLDCKRTGNTTRINSNLVDISGNVDISGATAIEKTLRVGGNVNLESDLTVHGETTTINSNLVDISGNVDISGATAIEKTLTVNGNVDMNSNIDIRSHDGSSTGLKLAGAVLVTSSAAELNYLDMTTLGVSEDNKAVTQKDSLVDIDGSMNIRGNLFVQGTTTSNSSEVDISDANINLASTSSPSDITAENGGFTVNVMRWSI